MIMANIGRSVVMHMAILVGADARGMIRAAADVKGLVDIMGRRFAAVCLSDQPGAQTQDVWNGVANLIKIRTELDMRMGHRYL
ncbi:hypothetical protein BJX64DRAFT_246108 [Aspergillus heterothallicus]